MKQIFVCTIFPGLVAVLLLGGCTRPVEHHENGAVINLMKPENTAQALSLSRLMINVRHPSKPSPAVFIFDNGDSGVALQSTFEISLLTGSGQLVQVMAVYNDDSASGMVFYYKEFVMDLVAGSNTLNVVFTENDQLGSSSGIEGRAIGRYATGSQANPIYPTAFLDLVYDPGAGKEK